MAQIKKQHYVPRFYLKSFANERSQIYVYDKPLSKSFSAHVDDVASTKYFYDIKELDDLVGIPQTLEKFFHPIEDTGADAIRHILTQFQNGIFSRIGNDWRRIMSEYLAIQFMRTPEFRTTLVELSEKVLQSLFITFLSANHPELLKNEIAVEINKDKIPKLHAQQLLNFEWVSRLSATIEDHFWMIVLNNTKVPFYTSDSPFVKHGHLGTEVRHHSGFRSPGIEMFFPLSPILGVSIVDKKHFARLGCLDGLVMPLHDPQNVIFYNSIQVMDSTRQVFCNRDYFDLVREMCAAESEFANPKRNRVSGGLSNDSI